MVVQDCEYPLIQRSLKWKNLSLLIVEIVKMLDSIINLFSSSLPVEDETEGFHRRIAVCVDQWNPSSEVWATLLQLLDKKERTRIQRFRKRSDAKESLVGRLLLR